MISVIVPVYNVEQYLTKCIDSIINQTKKELQIILVNDGSTDSSGEICDNYKEKDGRICVIHKKNGGLSSARNAGIDIATGEYLAFIDSDDWIEPDFFELLYKGIQQFNADISVVQFAKVKKFENINYISDVHTEWYKYNTKEAMKILFSDKIIGYSAVNKLYKTILFSDIRYPEGLLMEDKATTYKLIDKSKSIVVNKSQKYHYYLRANSIMRKEFNEKNFDSFLIHEEIIRFMNDNYPDLINVVKARYVYAAIRMIIMMIKSRYEEKIKYAKCLKIIKENKAYLLTEKNISIKIKLVVILFLLVPGLPSLLINNSMLNRQINKINIS